MLGYSCAKYSFGPDGICSQTSDIWPEVERQRVLKVEPTNGMTWRSLDISYGWSMTKDHSIYNRNTYYHKDESGTCPIQIEIHVGWDSVSFIHIDNSPSIIKQNILSHFTYLKLCNQQIIWRQSLRPHSFSLISVLDTCLPLSISKRHVDIILVAS